MHNFYWWELHFICLILPLCFYLIIPQLIFYCRPMFLKVSTTNILSWVIVVGHVWCSVGALASFLASDHKMSIVTSPSCCNQMCHQVCPGLSNCLLVRTADKAVYHVYFFFSPLTTFSLGNNLSFIHVKENCEHEPAVPRAWKSFVRLNK